MHHRVLPQDMPMQIIGVLVGELPCGTSCIFKALTEILEQLRHAIIRQCICCGTAFNCGVALEKQVFVRRTPGNLESLYKRIAFFYRHTSRNKDNYTAPGGGEHKQDNHVLQIIGVIVANLESKGHDQRLEANDWKGAGTNLGLEPNAMWDWIGLPCIALGWIGLGCIRLYWLDFSICFLVPCNSKNPTAIAN